MTTDTMTNEILAHPWFRGITLEDIHNKSAMVTGRNGEVYDALMPFEPYLTQLLLQSGTQMSDIEKKAIRIFNQVCSLLPLVFTIS